MSWLSSKKYKIGTIQTTLGVGDIWKHMLVLDIFYLSSTKTPNPSIFGKKNNKIPECDTVWLKLDFALGISRQMKRLQEASNHLSLLNAYQEMEEQEENELKDKE